MWLEVQFVNSALRDWEKNPLTPYPITVNTDHIREIRSMDPTRDGTCMLMFHDGTDMVVFHRYQEFAKKLEVAPLKPTLGAQQNPKIILTEEDAKPIPFKARGTTTAAINQG